jgi:hypothetical protein
MNLSQKRQAVSRIGNPTYLEPDRISVQAISTPKGIPGVQLLRFAGSIPPEDVTEMKEAIEQGCERADDCEW